MVRSVYGKELAAVDGSKIRANSSRRNIHTQKGTEKELASLEKKIGEYMNALEESDAAETDEVKLSPEAIHEILRRFNEKKDKLNDWLTNIYRNGSKEISTVDPDAQVHFAWAKFASHYRVMEFCVTEVCLVHANFGRAKFVQAIMLQTMRNFNAKFFYAHGRLWAES
ncbi:MAG: hypothetical protein LBK41_02940 [Clostridiales bacterium]|jgi:hypothetical protein|nr:hypothetical protein [Clostridiales bacterium]